MFCVTEEQDTCEQLCLRLTSKDDNHQTFLSAADEVVAEVVITLLGLTIQLFRIATIEDCDTYYIPAGIFKTIQLVIFEGQKFCGWEAKIISWVYIFVAYLL